MIGSVRWLGYLQRCLPCHCNGMSHFKLWHSLLQENCCTLHACTLIYITRTGIHKLCYAMFVAQIGLAGRQLYLCAIDEML